MEAKKIPSNINISKLDLSNSNLKLIPEEVFKLKNLRTLNLSNNSIKDIPKEISNLKMLEVLDISNNKISNFFAKLCELKKLKSLNLNNNQIPTIPKQISNLTQLREFLIANNKIGILPAEFSKLTNLVALNISKNPIIELPNSVYELPNIKQLWICDLPLKKVYFKVLTQRLKYLKSIYAFSKIDDVNSVDAGYYKLSQIKGNSIRSLHQINEKLTPKVYEKTKGKTAILNQSNDTQLQEKSTVFISYSHLDKKWLTKVSTHLKVLKHQNNIDFDYWDDTKIKAGDNWKEKIETALNSSKVAILIISTDFLASDFIQSNELPALLNNANANGTKLLSLIVLPCRFKNQAGLNDLQALNDPSTPLSKMNESDQEETLVKLADRVEEILRDK